MTTTTTTRKKIPIWWSWYKFPLLSSYLTTQADRIASDIKSDIVERKLWEFEKCKECECECVEKGQKRRLALIVKLLSHSTDGKAHDFIRCVCFTIAHATHFFRGLSHLIEKPAFALKVYCCVHFGGRNICVCTVHPMKCGERRRRKHTQVFVEQGELKLHTHIYSVIEIKRIKYTNTIHNPVRYDHWMLNVLLPKINVYSKSTIEPALKRIKRSIFMLIPFHVVHQIFFDI